MRATIFLSVIFATVAIAAPILDGTLTATEDKVSQLVDSLETTVSGTTDGLTKRTLAELDQLDAGNTVEEIENEIEAAVPTSIIKRVDLDSLNAEASLDEVETEVENLVPANLLNTRVIPGIDSLDLDNTLDELASELEVPSVSLNKRQIELNNILSDVDGLLTDILSDVSGLETTVSNLLTDIENADVEGVLSTVETEATAILNQVQEIATSAGVNVDLSQLTPTLDIVSNEVSTLIADVQSLIDAGVVGDLVDEIESVLNDVLTLVKSLNL